MPHHTSPDRSISLASAKHRLSILRQLESWLDMPMAALSAVWLALMVVEFGWGLSRFGEQATTIIWAIFAIDFVLRLTLAPRKLRYIRRNWLTAISLLLPALRLFRVTRFLRILARFRGLQLVRVLGSINRGMKSLGKTMRRRGFGYVAVLTVIVTIAGAAGMFHFEKSLPGGEGLTDFWTALWWTAMIITTMGSEYWPKSVEGRLLCLFLAIYAFSVFGYFTGVVATYFIDRDTQTKEANVVSRQDIEALKQEVALLRQTLQENQTKHE